MTSNSAIIGELSTNQKLEDANYDICHQKIYYLNKKDLLEHLTIAKSPSLDKDKDGKPISIAYVQYQESLLDYQTDPIRMSEHALQCYITYTTILLVSLRVVPL